MASRPPWFVVINNASGSQDGKDLAELIRDKVSAAGHQVSVRLITHAEELDAIAAHAATQARERMGVLVGVGGDGTLNAVASAALAAGAAFSLIPGGTFNYFGRCHGFPVDPREAVDAVLGGRLRPVQVGCVNGRPFLVNASFGLYPRLLAEREAFKRQWGRSRMVAWGAALLTLMGAHGVHRLRLKTGDVTNDLQAATVFVGNNRLQLEDIGVPEADAVEAGRLVGLVLHPVGRLGLLRLAAQGALGRLGETEDVQRLVFSSLEVMPGRQWWQRRSVRVAVDGEQLRLRSPLRFEVGEMPLWLLAPSPGGVKENV